MDKTNERGGDANTRDVHASVPLPPERLSLLPERAGDSGDEKDQAVVRLLRKRGPSTARDLMQALNCTRWAIRSSLERLRAAGVVRASAASARSPLQMYEIV